MHITLKYLIHFASITLKHTGDKYIGKSFYWQIADIR